LQVVRLHSKILGHEHPDTLSSLSSWAVTLGDLGKMEQAEALERQVNPLRKAKLASA